MNGEQISTAAIEFPLSLGQESLWLVEQMAPGNSAYNLAEAWRLKGRLNLEALQWSLDEIVRRHETLRTTFSISDGNPVQEIHEPKPFELALRELSGCPNPQAELAKLMQEEARRPFDLSHAPLLRLSLFRLGTEEHVLVLNLHHLISDEWSVGVLMRELAELYGARVSGKASPLNQLAIQYADFTLWQRELVETGLLEKPLSYWKEQLSDELPVLALPTDYPRPAVVSLQGATQFFMLPKGVTEELKTLSRRAGGTLFMTLLAAFKTLLHRYSGQDDILVGSPTAGRDRTEIEGLIGFFVNIVPLRTKLNGDPSFLELLRRVREVTLAAFAHQEVPLETIMKSLSLEREPSHHPLFQVLFGQQTAATEEWRLPGLTASRIELENGASKFDLSLLATETPQGLRVRCEYRTDLFEATTIARMWSHLETLLKRIIAEPGQVLSRLQLVPEAERIQLLTEWNNTATDYPREQCLHELFHAQAKKTPEAEALICGAQSLTYLELERQAEHLASQLRRLNVGPDVLVGICLERSISLVVALLAVLKAGGAYVPMDPAYPRDRLAFMLEDAKVAVLLTQKKLLGSRPAGQAKVVCVEDLLPNDPHFGEFAAFGVHPLGCPPPANTLKNENPSLLAAGPSQTGDRVGAPGEPYPLPPASSSSNLAYVIYTSGSTGRPKGVALEHRGAVALVSWAKSWFSPQELSGVLASTSICFDLSVFELFVPLCTGGKVILAENALALATLAAANQVTLINTVPSAMRELLRLKAVPSSVRVVNLAGEPLPAALVEQIYRETAAQKVYDLYGPTETTTYSTGALRKSGEPATIGRPLANEQVYLLDRHFQPVPIGVAGELFIGGDGLARGYLNRPELTAEKFIAVAFAGQEAKSRRLYRTGDLARWRADGKLEFLGRIDHQVKIRGFRIELGEVEAALKKHPEVAEAVVVAREEPFNKLVAYVVPQEGKQLGDEGLRAFLEKQLPQFMVPSDIVFLAELPLTPNGKLDRRALPSPESMNSPSAEDFVAARNPLEAALVEIWREILRREAIGVHENFFHLGGHSLMATQVISRIGKTLGVELPLRTIFEAPTIAKLAEAVAAAQGEKRTEPTVIRRAARVSNPGELLNRLEGLSDEEVEALLRELDGKELLA